MLKRHKTLLIGLVLLSFLVAGSPVLAENPPAPSEVDTSFTQFDEDEKINVKDLDIEPINTQSIKKDVIPNPKSEGKKVIGLFLKTMLAVMLSTVVLYFVLYFVKKFYGGIFIKGSCNDEVESLDLSTPPTKQEALKSFLKRTSNR